MTIAPEPGYDDLGAVVSPRGPEGASAPEAPATGVSTDVAVHHAVDRARGASASWRLVDPTQRARHLLAIRTSLLDRMDEIVATVVEETGKLATEVIVNEVLLTCELITYYARKGPAMLRPRTVSPGLFAHKTAEKRYEPLGVVAVIAPWNYPVVLTMGPLVTALMAGNTVVLKPSEITPRTGLVLGEVIAAAANSAHPDLVQVLTGGGDVGEALVRSAVDKVAFTGSVATGKRVMQAAADSLTPVHLELGGKDPMIVCSDADLDRAAKAAVWGAFTNCGQTCMAIERVYVVDGVYDEFVAKVLDETAAVRQGTGPHHDIGATVNERQLSVVESHVADAVDRGATVACGGKTVAVGGRRSMEPTVLLDVDHTMAAMTDETFGPLLPIMKVSDPDEALALANDSPFGLNASVWGKDERTVETLVAGLESGNVCVNDVMISYAVPGLPFGGVKQSGIGRSHGPEGLYEFSQIKSVARDRLRLGRELQWLPLPKHLDAVTRLLMRMKYRRRR